MSTSLVVVEDHVLVASALARALGVVDGLEVVGVAAGVEDAARLLARHRPHVALVDLRLGERSALDHLADLRAASPQTALLVVTGWPSATAAQRALDAGARGLIAKSRPLDDLVEAVRQVRAGQLAIEPAVVEELVRCAADPTGGGRPGARDLEVLAMLADARSTVDIARSLHLTEQAVRTRVRDCLAALGAHSRAQAVAEATRRGWLLPPEPVLALRAVDP